MTTSWAGKVHVCLMHYKRWLRHGSFAQPTDPVPGPCSIKGCPRKARSTGVIDKKSPSAIYCDSHYQNKRQYGDPLHADKQRELHQLIGVRAGNGYRRYPNGGALVHRVVAGAKPTDVVHHIDHDITNNTRRNLVIFPNRSEHGLAHGSLDALIPDLVHRGIIRFDRKSMRYVAGKP